MDVLKRLRHAAVREIVASRPVRTQHELAEALAERGFRATQATISRDVSELGLVKSTRQGPPVYTLPARTREAETSPGERLAALLHDLPIELHESGLLLVVRTLPGSAHAIAATIDRMRWKEVAGSIAGDDTVFIACSDRGSLARLRKRLARLLA